MCKLHNYMILASPFVSSRTVSQASQLTALTPPDTSYSLALSLMAALRAALVDYENTKYTGHYLLVLVPTILLMKTQLTALCNSVPSHSDYQAEIGAGCMWLQSPS